MWVTSAFNNIDMDHFHGPNDLCIDLVRSRLFSLFCLLILLMCSQSSIAQDLEPRRWSQMPTGLNFFGVDIGHIDGDIFLDPVLLVEDATFDIEAIGLSYVCSFGLAGKSARVDISVPYRAVRWEGTAR